MAARKRFIKDVGLALAALSVYFLALLTPLHHVSATQNSLAELGFETAGTWTICSVDGAQDREKPFAVQCPVCCLVKAQGFIPPTIDYVAANPLVRPEPPIVSERLAPHPFDVNFRAAPRAPPLAASV